MSETLRAALYCQAVLPLLSVLAENDPGVAKLLQGLKATVTLEAAGFGARITLSDNKLLVAAASEQESTLRFRFRDLASMNAFFSGKPVLPRILPYFGLTHPVLLTRFGRLLAALRLLEPPPPDAPLPPPEERALRVRLLLYLVTRALSVLHHEGFETMAELAEKSPERVYLWTVFGTDIAAFLRMHNGRVHSGRGMYSRRRPFVHFAFPSVDAAYAVLTASGSQMTGFRGRNVETYGSPEYTRKIALLMQQVDALLLAG